MAGKKGRSGGHNKVKVIWGEMEFQSRKSLAEYHSVKSNTLQYYIDRGVPFRGKCIDYAL